MSHRLDGAVRVTGGFVLLSAWYELEKGAAEDLLDKPPDPGGGGDAQALPGRVDVRQVRADGHAV